MLHLERRQYGPGPHRRRWLCQIKSQPILRVPQRLLYPLAWPGGDRLRVERHQPAAGSARVTDDRQRFHVFKLNDSRAVSKPHSPTRSARSGRPSRSGQDRSHRLGPNSASRAVWRSETLFAHANNTSQIQCCVAARQPTAAPPERCTIPSTVCAEHWLLFSRFLRKNLQEPFFPRFCSSRIKNRPTKIVRNVRFCSCIDKHFYD